MNEEPRTVADATAAADDGSGAPARRERAMLIVYLDDSGPGGRTRLVELPDAAEVVFGRSRASTVHVDSDKVSRSHARVRRDGDAIVVEDLGSRNGTKVNGATIAGPTRLESGDEISIGPATAVISVTSRRVRRTPIGTAAYLEERLEAEADRGLRHNRPFALVMIELSAPGELAETALDGIAAQLRPMDVLCEDGPESIAILVPEADSAAAAELAARLLREARNLDGAIDRIVARAGFAAFPGHATRAGELLSRARAALRRAFAEGADAPVAAETTAEIRESDIVVGDPQMKRVYSLVRKVADTGMTVLVVGETGVGKEVVAEALHRASARKNEPFVRLNCASIPETLLESELFGHERGAFTGADRRKEGYFEAADGGTIFLDEIGETPPGIQAKLLRVLEEHTFTRVGGTAEISVDVRVVCATNRDLEEEVRRGTFREDLFFRISAFTVVVPPLRDRRGEIRLLAERFATDIAGEIGAAAPVLGDEALAVFERYDWPGNVRELRNAIERAVVLCDTGMIGLEHLPDRVRSADTPGGVSVASAVDVRGQIADVEKAAIVSAMEECGGNQTHAARKLGISRRALIYKLEKHGLKKPPKSRRQG